MGLIQAISDFIDSIFNRNSPEVQKRLRLKKIDAELRTYNPALFRDGLILPNFAEAVRILYVNTKPIDALLADTIGSTDIQKSARFESQLVITGFSMQEQKVITSLSYDSRKEELDNTNLTISQIFDGQQRRLDKIISDLHTDAFKQIDSEILAVRHLADFCKFSFIYILRIFDPNFNSSASSESNSSFISVPIEKLENLLEDLYFVSKGLSINTASARILSALANLRGQAASEKYTEELLTASLKKIAYVLNHILSAEKLKTLICYIKNDTDYIPKSADYKHSASSNFSRILQAKFKSDEQRIKTEMKDDKISHELSGLFGNTLLLSLDGYNDALNAKLMENSAPAFTWIMPMRILKTFASVYLNNQVRALLNDIVVEGFFNNPSYKTDFSDDVFAVLELEEKIRTFEVKFSVGNPYSISNIEGYIRDIHNDPGFVKKLEQLVNEANAEAGKLIPRAVNAINKVSKHISGILQDAKKPASENIANLKVLMMSSRNRDNTDLLERQYPSWQIFFEIMKNYAIILS